MVIVSTEPVPEPCVQAAASAPPLLGSPLSIAQLVPLISTADDDTAVAERVFATLHHVVSSASGNSIVIVPPVGMVVAGSIARIISTSCPVLPFNPDFSLLREIYTACNAAA